MFPFPQPRPLEKPVREIRTPNIILKQLLFSEDAMHIKLIRDMIRNSRLKRVAGQILYYPVRRLDLPERLQGLDTEALTIIMNLYSKLQTAISDVLVGEMGCNTLCVGDPEFERKDLKTTGFLPVKGKANWLLKEGNPYNPVPKANIEFPGSEFGIREKLVRVLGLDGKIRMLKLVENLAGSEILMESNNFSQIQNLQALVDTMKECEKKHAQNLVHRDIKPAHILLNQNYDRKHGVKGKLADQELQTEYGKIQPNENGELVFQGTNGYYDIGYFKYSLFDKTWIQPAMDVFAYAITLLKVYLGDKHYSFIDALVFNEDRKTLKGYDGDITKKDIFKALEKIGCEKDAIPKDILKIVLKCLRMNRGRRPKLFQLRKFLQEKYNLE